MKFRSLHKWDLAAPVEGLVFFAQRLDEMLFSYALDSYKPRTLNAPFLCTEAINLLSDIESKLMDPSSAEHVIAELKASISGDIVAKSLLDVDWEKYFVDPEKEGIARQRLRLEVLRTTLDSRRYLERLSELLAAAIKNSHKKKIEILAGSLITTLINIGVSKGHLYRQTLDFFFLGQEPRISSPDQIGDFLDRIMPVSHNFDIYYVASGLIREVAQSLEPFKIKILSELPEDIRAFAEENGFTKTEDEVFLEVADTRQFDSIAARDQADRRLDMLQDLFTLFHHKEQISWRDRAIIKQCCTESPCIVGPSANAMQKSFDLSAERASRQLNWLLENIALRSNEGFEKFNRIVDLHGICVTANVPENQLLNLWIALETIVPSNVRRNKINNIVTSIEPFVRLTYVKRLVDRVMFDLVLWDRFKARRHLRKVDDSKGVPLPIKVLRLLADAENESLRQELYASLKDYHLLRNRVFRLSEVLQSPEKLRSLLDEHAQRVDWQIRRIYRTRNLIVHTGRTPKYIGALIENGHEYLDLVLEEIMELTCGEYNAPSLEQVFELERLHWQKYQAQLAQAGQFKGRGCDFLYRSHKRGSA